MLQERGLQLSSKQLPPTTPLPKQQQPALLRRRLAL
jgi:hypothetical protein